VPVGHLLGVSMIVVSCRRLFYKVYAGIDDKQIGNRLKTGSIRLGSICSAKLLLVPLSPVFSFKVR
jgi:hypothetical protein